MKKYSVKKDDEDPLRSIAETKETLVAASDVRTTREAGTLAETSMATRAIDKYTGQRQSRPLILETPPAR
jgi:hypothetical protein